MLLKKTKHIQVMACYTIITLLMNEENTIVITHLYGIIMVID